jgi:hypothetical protein
MLIPLTTHTRKIRIKERDNIYRYGNPTATRSYPFTPKHYVEWQIGFDSERPNPNIPVSFQNYKGKTKYLYELSEALYYLTKNNIVSKKEIQNLLSRVSNILQESLIERHPDCKKSNSRKYK